MKVFLVGSKSSFGKVPSIKEELQRFGHTVSVPAGFDTPTKEVETKAAGREAFVAFKTQMFKEQIEKVGATDAILVLNFEKNGQQNYIGGATFLEVFKAWELGKKIFFYNPLPEGILHDELLGMSPIVVNGSLALIQ